MLRRYNGVDCGGDDVHQLVDFIECNCQGRGDVEGLGQRANPDAVRETFARDAPGAAFVGRVGRGGGFVAYELPGSEESTLARAGDVMVLSQAAEVLAKASGFRWQVGESLLVDPRTQYAFEKMPKSAVEEVVLEEVPDVTYERIGGLSEQIEILRDAIELPYTHPEAFADHQLSPPKGILLYGPPGCGKTLIAKAVANSLARSIEQRVAADVTKVQEIGGLTGRVILAWLAVVIVSRRSLIRVFQIPGLIVMPLVFAWAATSHLSWLYVGIFLAGLLTVAQFSFWGNYLPRVYPVHLRGTGESFAANIGGRMVGTFMAVVTVQLANVMPGTVPPHKLTYAAAVVAFAVYALGFAASFWLPEPTKDDLPE